MPILHLLIRELTDFERLAIYLYARPAFPEGVPIMDGSGYPVQFRNRIEAELDAGKSWVSDQAASYDGHIRMFLMKPDPHGSGGSRSGSCASVLEV